MGSEAVSKRAAISVPIFNLMFMLFQVPKGGAARGAKLASKIVSKTAFI